MAPGGEYYGTTYDGGASGYGVVFKVDMTGTETLLYTFTGEADGANPVAGRCELEPAFRVAETRLQRTHQRI
jgi:uncharacterized repeat protein (TIGR03803 family)